MNEMPRSKNRDSTYSISTTGSNGGIIIPNSPSLNPTDYMAIVMRVWLREGVVGILFDNSTNGVTQSLFCSVDGIGRLSIFSTIGGISRNLVSVKAVYKPNAYNDYVFLYDGTKLAIMANGEVAGTLYVSGALGTNSGPLRLGQYFNSAIASQALFSVLKVFHINTLNLQDHLDFIYKDYFRPELEDSCVLDVDSRTGSGTTVFDLSGQGNHGTFTRGVWSTVVPYKARASSNGRVSADDRVTAASRLKIITDYADSTIITRILTLQAWYRGDSVVGQADGSLQTAWNDVSGNAKHVASSGALRPTFYNSTPGQLLNGLPTMFFSGSNSFKLDTGFTGQPFTVFIVARSNIEPGLQYFFDGPTLYSSALYRLSLNTRIFAGSAMGFVPSTGTPWRIMTGVFNGTRSVCGVDAAEVLGNAGASASVGITLGAGGNNSAGLNGNIAEVIVTVGVVDESVRRQVRQYLAVKYNLPI